MARRRRREPVDIAVTVSPKICAGPKRKKKPEATRPGSSLPWGEFEVNGQRYAIELFFRDEDGTNPRSYFGQTTYEENLIEALVDGEDFTFDTLIHEFIHAAFGASNLKFAIRSKISKKELSPAKLKWLEELLATTLPGLIIATFRKLGWLQLPALPANPRHRKPR